MITIECSTLFDITFTGVTGHYKPSRTPLLDGDAWNRARNQQRNLETLTQIVSLRTQIDEVTKPVEKDGVWTFTFSSDTPGVFGTVNDPTEILKEDSNGVPMLRELNNDPDIDTVLVTSGPRQNVWFNVVSINI